MLLTVRETADRLRVSARTAFRAPDFERGGQDLASCASIRYRGQDRLPVTRFAGCMGLGWDKPPA